MIALVGDAPPELSAMDLRHYPPVLIGCGDEDAWYDEAKLEADLKLLGDAGVPVEPFRFRGGTYL